MTTLPKKFSVACPKGCEPIAAVVPEGEGPAQTLAGVKKAWHEHMRTKHPEEAELEELTPDHAPVHAEFTA